MRMTKVFLSLFIIFFFFVLPVSAQEEESTFSAEIKEKIKERLEKNATVSGQNKETDPAISLKYYAWVGSLNKVEADFVFVTTDEGEKQAAVNKNTTILQTEKGKSRKEIKVSELKTGNFIIAIGIKEGEKIKATRIISAPAETEIEKKVIFGKVTEADEEKIKLSNGEPNTLPLTSKTNIKINGFAKTAKISNIELEDRVFAMVALKDGQISETKTIFVLPGKNAPQPTSGTEGSLSEQATPSAIATPSGSPK